jgi:hypothetical protein
VQQVCLEEVVGGEEGSCHFLAQRLHVEREVLELGEGAHCRGQSCNVRKGDRDMNNTIPPPRGGEGRRGEPHVVVP